jgi:REP element-mobilizing transposase RayT
MARQPRVDFAGAIHHITSRGDRKEAIYRDDFDRQTWLQILGAVCEQFRWTVHAFCQMGNHYHLVAEMSEPNLSQGMRQLNGRYTQRFNYRLGCAGHVFQARYHSELVQRQTHLLELMRYVVLNPVRAGMVASAEEWEWSSFAMTCGATPSPAWLQTDWALEQFAGQRDAAVRAYRGFVHNGVRSAGPDPWANLQ